MTWTQLAAWHKHLIFGLFFISLGAWGQSISVQLPRLEWRAKQQHVAAVKLEKTQIALQRTKSNLQLTAAQLKAQKERVEYCRKLLAGGLW